MRAPEGPRFAAFVGVGSGKCDLEVEWLSPPPAKGHADCVIDFVDLNAAMLERGRLAAAKGYRLRALSSGKISINDAQSTNTTPSSRIRLYHILNLEELSPMETFSPTDGLLICGLSSFLFIYWLESSCYTLQHPQRPGNGSSLVHGLDTIRHRNPAAVAAVRPRGESSTTTHASGFKPCRANAVRYGSGCGLARR